jgi:hypothetical protein
MPKVETTETKKRQCGKGDKDADEGEGEEDDTPEEQEEEENSDDGEEEKGKERFDYTPKRFLEDVYTAGSKAGYPLGGGVSRYQSTEVKGLLESNYKKILEEKKSNSNFKSTWLVVPSDIGVSASSSAYYNNTNKVVVVVLSKLFFYPSQKGGGRATQNSPIIVCNVPYGTEKNVSKLSDHYKRIFRQIGAFLTRYNSKEYANTDKIDLIAISYPKSLLDSMNKKKSKQPAPSKSKSKGTKAAKKKKGQGQKGKVKNTDKNEEENKDGDEDEDEDEDEGEGSGVNEGQEDNEADIEDSDELQDTWLHALDEWLGNKDFDDITMKLMYEENDEVWGAPVEVKKYFEKNDSLLKRVPFCINSGKSDEERTVNLEDLKTTMFVCDLEPGKRVGNSNSHESTGGVFGMWVPMHYTAAYIDNKSQSKYTVESADKIASLIELIEVTTDGSLHQSTDDKGPTATATNETKIDTSKLEESVDERRKLVGTMNKIYNTGFGPPEWVGDKYVAKKTFDQYAKKSKTILRRGSIGRTSQESC